MTRRATIRTAHADPETIAAALAPDNTDEMETRVEDGERVVVTTIERDSTSGLQSTVDDTLVNLDVARGVATHARGEGSTDHEATNAADDATTRTESTDDRPQTDTNDTL